MSNVNTNPPCANCPHRATSHIDTADAPPRQPKTCQFEKCPCEQYVAMIPPPKYAITFHTDEYRGDHAADVTIAYPYQQGETVEELMTRVAQSRKPIKEVDFVTIRIVHE